MTSRRVFLAAGVLVAGLLSVAFMTPEPPDDVPAANASDQYPSDGRYGDRYGVNGLADPKLPPNEITKAELDAIFAEETNRKQAEVPEGRPAPAKRSLWDRLLGRDKRREPEPPAPKSP
jgi:hypothetical protein